MLKNPVLFDNLKNVLPNILNTKSEYITTKRIIKFLKNVFPNKRILCKHIHCFVFIEKCSDLKINTSNLAALQDEMRKEVDFLM